MAVFIAVFVRLTAPFNNSDCSFSLLVVFVCLVDCFLFIVCLFVCLFVLFVRSFVRCLFYSLLTCLFAYLIVRLFVCSFVRSFVCLFVCLLVCMCVCIASLLPCFLACLSVLLFVLLVPSFCFFAWCVCLSVWLSRSLLSSLPICFCMFVCTLLLLNSLLPPACLKQPLASLFESLSFWDLQACLSQPFGSKRR